MIFTKTPTYLQRSFSKIMWRGSEQDSIYLTFDDGPTPIVTEWVLDLLKEYDAKATFFCIGKNVLENPDLFNRISAEGHSIGNHTQNHPHGWRTSKKVYLQEVKAADEIIKSKLFRPPYGELTWFQYQALKEKYQIVMWDVVSWDFGKDQKAEVCYENVVRHSQGGSIIVYHDKTSCFNILKDNLPRLLLHFKESGYKLKAISA